MLQCTSWRQIFLIGVFYFFFPQPSPDTAFGSEGAIQRLQIIALLHFCACDETGAAFGAELALSEAAGAGIADTSSLPGAKGSVGVGSAKSARRRRQNGWGGSSPNCCAFGTGAQDCGTRGSSRISAPGVPAVLGWMGGCGGGQEGTRMLEVGHHCATPWGRLHRVGAGQVCVLAWGCIRGKMFSSPAAVSGLARRSSLMQVAV